MSHTGDCDHLMGPCVERIDLDDGTVHAEPVTDAVRIVHSRHGEVTEWTLSRVQARKLAMQLLVASTTEDSSGRAMAHALQAATEDAGGVA